MSKKVPTFMYSEDHPNGKQFDLDADDVAEMEADGWVDAPNKVPGHENYEGDDENYEGDDLDEHADKLAAAEQANNLTRPAGLPRGAKPSTIVSVSDEDVGKAPKRARKPKTASGKGKAETKAEQVSGKPESELPNAPADASNDAVQLDADGKPIVPPVAPMTAD